MSDHEPIVELRNVSRSFGQSTVRAVDGVTLQVFPGEIVSLLGPSGCGKTTTMRMIAGLDAPSDGEILIHGRNVAGVPSHRRNVGLVFQSLAIFPHMTVRGNVAFGLRMKRLPKAVIEAEVDRLLTLVQLPVREFADRYPSALSGGQKQRVALARTLVTEPAVVLFDEPMAALDRRLRDYMAIELRTIQKRLGFAAIYVTHDQETASAMSDRLAIMEAGRIVQVGPPAAVYRTPATRFVADFLGDANFLLPEPMGTDGGDFLLRVLGATLRAADDPGASSVVMVRPEHVRLGTRPVENAARGTIVTGQFGGGSWHWQIALADGQRVIARSDRELIESDLDNGTLWLSIDPGDARLIRQ